MAKSYFRVNEFKKEVLDSRKVVFDRGYDIGFHSAKPYLSLKKKFTSFLYSHPFTGKTSFVFDIYIHIAKTYGATIAIYSPESGGRSYLISYLVQVYLGKKLHGEGQKSATDEEWLEALEFIDKHFIILAPKVVGADAVRFTTKELFKQVYEAQKEYKCKVDILLIDPHNMLSKDDEERRKSVADYILENLYYINHVADSMDMHIQIAMHLAAEDLIQDKETGIEYMGKPYPSKIHNGMNVWRTAQTMFGLWKCPSGVMDKKVGYPYPENATDFMVQKNKIFGAGEVGTFRLYYDNLSQKHYELINGKKYYCGEYDNPKPKVEPSVLQPNYNFDNDIKF